MFRSYNILSFYLVLFQCIAVLQAGARLEIKILKEDSRELVIELKGELDSNPGKQSLTLNGRLPLNIKDSLAPQAEILKIALPPATELIPSLYQVRYIPVYYEGLISDKILIKPAISQGQKGIIRNQYINTILVFPYAKNSRGHLQFLKSARLRLVKTRTASKLIKTEPVAYGYQTDSKAGEKMLKSLVLNYEKGKSLRIRKKISADKKAKMLAQSTAFTTPFLNIYIKKRGLLYF